MYLLNQFKALPPERQLQQLSLHAVSLDLVFDNGSTEAVLFAYHDFYVELVVERLIDEIHSLRCFRSPDKLEPYLHLVDISDITALLTCNE